MRAYRAVRIMPAKPKKPEIMSPAGDFICLSAALKAGADAVYFGLKGSNMRAGAKNFAVSEIKELVRQCAARGAKSYLTLNTIYFERESKEIAAQIRAAKRAGVSAVIAWDFSVIEKAREIGMPVFLSTQASVANASAIAAYALNFGLRRFVLARECTLGDIADIRKALPKKLGKDIAKEISIEVFAHGAMCVSVSGRCFLSQFSCGKSANRGECIQPCRREFIVTDAVKGGIEYRVENSRVFSPKDLCTLPFIEKLFDAGVDSLKIEGRNRNAEYVFNTTSAYREVRDFYFGNFKNPNFENEFEKVKAAAMERLGAVFNRGFSDGFYMGKPIGDWTGGGNEAKVKKAIVGHVVNYFPKAGAAEISIDANAVSVGDEIQIEGDKTGFLSMKIESMQVCGRPVETARKGENVAIKVPQKLRKMDRIYILK